MRPAILRAGLLTVAAAVWGAVAWKAVHRSTAPAAAGIVERPAPRTTVAEPDRPALDLHWRRDPFLDGGPRTVVDQRERPRKAGTAAQVLVRNARTPERPQVTWPPMVYKGLVNGGGDPARRVALLSVDGRDLALRSGDAWRGIRVTDVRPDSVLLEQQGFTRAVHRGVSAGPTNAEGGRHGR